MNEIWDICYYADVDLKKADLIGYLFMLSKTGLLKEVIHGDTFYVINENYNDVSFLSYKHNDSARMRDRQKIKFGMVAYIKASEDSTDVKRFKIITGASL